MSIFSKFMSTVSNLNINIGSLTIKGYDVEKDSIGNGGI
jgi:hypothetical protein